MRSIAFLFLSFSFFCNVQAQTCTAPGQNPSTALPVCGTSTFEQSTVPLCGGRPMAYKGCPGNGLTDINPFWYKFTCFAGGTLGFLITPSDLGDDYDWELYDVTGLDPNLVYSNASMVVSNNWSGETGLTGASNAGTQTFVCGGPGKALFSKMPTLIQGHNYLLLISHFTRTQSGYKLSFQGGSAVITDPNGPRLKSAEATCGGDVIKVGISKKIKCATIAKDGSDFYITPTGGNIISATGINCSSTFDADSIELRLSGFLNLGAYELHIKKGTDNNTLTDFCDVAVPESDVALFTIFPRAPTKMDSIATIQCAPNKIKLIFKTAISCSSIAGDGSDFKINGNYPVSIISVVGNCTNGSTKEIILNFSTTLQKAGTFQLTLLNGSDGNTLLNECGEETPAGSTLTFSVKDTVNANFNYTINYGCQADTVAFFHDGKNGVTTWYWRLDENIQSNQQNPVALYKQFDLKNIKLVVSNGFCSDSLSKTVSLNNFLKADFNSFTDNCPNEPVTFTSAAQGAIRSHLWNFGDGSTSSLPSPSHTFAQPLRDLPINVVYSVTDSFNCTATIQKKIIVYASCLLAIPSGFTPNGDGLNDTFFPANAIKAENLEFIIFNRWGQLIYKTADWKKGWDGSVNGKQQATGVYIWMLHFTDRDTKKKIEQRGTVTLIR